MKSETVDMPNNPTTAWWQAKKSEWMNEYADAAQDRWTEYSDALLMEAMIKSMVARDDKARVDWLTEVSVADSFAAYPPLDRDWWLGQRELEAEFSRRCLPLGLIIDCDFLSYDYAIDIWRDYYIQKMEEEPDISWRFCYYELCPTGEVELRIQDTANHNIGNINSSGGGLIYGGVELNS